MRSYRNIIFILVTAFAILIQLANPTLAYADGGTEPPPPTEVATEETPPEIPVATEVPTEDAPIVDPVESASTSIPAEEPTVAEIMQEITADTDIVVLDETGETLPLVTQAAAEIIAEGDPMWCPTGVTPPGGVGCTLPQTSFAALLLLINNKTVAGTIWIEKTYIGTSVLEGTTSVTINGSALGTTANYALTLQGGWTGTGDTIDLLTPSVFNIPLVITSWNAAVTVNNITVTGDFASASLNIDSSQDITLNYVQVSNNITSFDAVHLETTDPSTTVTIANSTFNNNKQGLWVDQGNVSVTDSVFHDNAVGAYFFNVSDVSVTGSTFTGDSLNVHAVTPSTSDVNISNSTFSGGAYLYDFLNATIADSTFSGNSGEGAKLENIGNNVTIANSTFNGNTQYGVWVNGANNIAVSGSFFNSNVNYGAYIESVNNISITGSAFNGNINHSGLYIKTANNVDVINSTFSRNGRNGVNIKQAKNIFISGGTLSGNGWDGAYMESVNDVSATNSTFNNNGYDGAWIQSVNDVSIVDSEFSGNAWNVEVGYEWVGAGIDTANHVTISNGRFNENDVGTYFYDVKSASITGSTFNKNRDAGLFASLDTGVSNITINDSVFSENAYYGIDVRAYDDATINLTIDCDNVSYQNNETNLYTEGNVIVNHCGGDDADQDVTPGSGQAVLSIPPDQDFVEFEMDCSLYDSYLVQWVGGDRVVLSCVEGGRARVSRVDNTTLPNDLPASFEYASAVAVEIYKNGVPLDLLSVTGVVQLGFVSRHENPNYGIVYWDEENGEWIVLKDYQLDAVGGSVSFPLHSSNPQDVYRVLSGVRPIVDGNRYRAEVTTNFPGIFVLAQQ